jgi:tryptophan synthase alpha chain
MAGDPDIDTTLKLMHALVEGGAKIIEIGMPFSDPVADGETIQQAGLRAMNNGVGLTQILDLVRKFRHDDQDTAVVLMGYYNPIYRYGDENFCAAATKVGIDGLIVVDLPPEEEDEILPHTKSCDIDLIRLITPNTTSERIRTITKNASGFIYYVSVAGTTGDKSTDYKKLPEAIARIRKESALPVAVGFGIKSHDDVTEVLKSADAAVVGSELIRKLQAADFDTNKAKAFFSTLTGL